MINNYNALFLLLFPVFIYIICIGSVDNIFSASYCSNFRLLLHAGSDACYCILFWSGKLRTL